MTAQSPAVLDFEHIKLSEVDDSRKPIEPNIYTLEVNKLEPVYREVKNPGSQYFGQKILVLRGSYTIVDDEKYSGRKLWQDMWMAFKVPQIFAKRLEAATGVLQADGEALSDWANQFATLSPPARFQVPVQLVRDERDPGTDEAPNLKNQIDFFNAKAAA